MVRLAPSPCPFWSHDPGFESRRLSHTVSQSSVSAGAVREKPAVCRVTELELSRRNWTEAKSEAFAPPFLCWQFPGSILPSRPRFRSLSGGPDPAGGAGLD